MYACLTSLLPARCVLTIPARLPVDRVQKLKDAHAEAAKEIDEYKKAKEHEFRAFEASVRDISPAAPP